MKSKIIRLLGKFFRDILGSCRKSRTTEPTEREPEPDINLDSTIEQTNNGVVRPAEPEEEPFVNLLPGIPDDITHFLLFPKLPWGTIRALSSLNYAWLVAIYRHLDDRLRSLATETEIQIGRFPVPCCENHQGFYLRSMADGFNYKLPPFRITGFPVGYQCLFLNGKVYALQRHFRGPLRRDCNGRGYSQGGSLFVMDLAGSLQWARCRNMPHAQRGTKILGVEGKICVWDGHASFAENKVQVYYPECNAWDLQIEPGSSVAQLDRSYYSHPANRA